MAENQPFLAGKYEKQSELIPQNPAGQIIQRTTEHDCLKYLGESGLQKLNDALPDNQKLQDYLPFYIEYVSAKTVTFNVLIKINRYL